MSPSGVSISSVVRLILGLRKDSLPSLPVKRTRDRGDGGNVPIGGANSLLSQRTSPLEDRVGHRHGQLAGKGVLLARVVAAQQVPATDLRLGAVAELRPRPRDRLAECPRRAQNPVPPEGAKGDQNPAVLQQLQLSLQVGEAGV